MPDVAQNGALRTVRRLGGLTVDAVSRLGYVARFFGAS